MAKKITRENEADIRKAAMGYAIQFANSHPHHVAQGAELINIATEIRDFLANDQEED